jgi:hypothetical protein
MISLFSSASPTLTFETRLEAMAMTLSFGGMTVPAEEVRVKAYTMRLKGGTVQPES